jgi:hypothetical protein
MPTNFYTHTNQAMSVVSVPRAAFATTLVVQNAAAFGTPTPNNPIRVSIRRGYTPLCILEVVGISGNVMTVSNALEGTTDVNMVVGDFAWQAITAADLTDIQNAVNSLEVVGTVASWNYTFMLGMGTPLVVGTSLTNALISTCVSTIKAVFAYAQTAPVGNSIVIQLNVNGSPIWTGNDALTIPTNQNSATVTTFDFANLKPGDLITIDVDQTGSLVPGQNVTVTLVSG